MSNIYYVYAYLREDMSPYYIGKGKKNRAWEKSHRVGLPNDTQKILILKEHMTESVAHALEMYLIKYFGRKDIGTGCLRNLTNGGEGCSGRFVTNETRKKLRETLTGRIMSEEWKNKLSESQIALWNTIEHRSKMKNRIAGMTGKIHSDDTKNKISASNIGRRFTDSHKHKLSESAKSRTPEQNAKYGLVHKGKPWTHARRLAYESKKIKEAKL